MRIRIALFCFTMAFPVVLASAKTPPKPADFSGKWTLDTNQTKNLPQGLESYAMEVNQNSRELKVKTQLKGDLRPTGDLSGPYPSPNSPQGPGYPDGTHGSVYGGGVGMGRGGMGRIGMPGGGREQPMGEGMPIPEGGGIGSGTQRMPRHPLENTVAFMLYPSNAVYKLDGSETSAQLGGPIHGDAMLKANWAKGGQELKLSLDGNEYSGMGGSVLIKDQWKLSKDGQTLMVDRTAHSRSGSLSMHLIFRKQST